MQARTCKKVNSQPAVVKENAPGTKAGGQRDNEAECAWNIASGLEIFRAKESGTAAPVNEKRKALSRRETEATMAALKPGV